MTKKSTKILIIILAAYFALIIALIAVAVTTVPSLYSSNSIEHSLNAFFPGRQDLQKVTEKLSKKGIDGNASIFLPGSLNSISKDIRFDIDALSGNAGSQNGSFEISAQVHESKVCLSVIYNKNTIAIKGLRAGDDEYLTLSRKNAVADLEASILSPDSGSAYALDESSFEQLKSELADLEANGADGPLSKKEAADMERAFKNITNKIEDCIDYNSSVSFAGSLIPNRSISASLNKEQAAIILDAILSEAERNSTFGKYIDSFYGFSNDDSYPGGNEAVPLSMTSDTPETSGGFEEFVSEFKENVDKLDVEFSLFTAGRLITEIRISGNIEGKNIASTTISMSVNIEYGKNSSVLRATIESKSSMNGKANEERITALISRTSPNENETETTFSITVKVKDPNTGASKSATTSLRLNYNSETGSYSLLTKQTGASAALELKGKYLLDPKLVSLELTVDDIFIDGEKILSEQMINISLKKSDSTKIKIPNGKSIFNMEEDEFEELLLNMPLYEIESILYDITGREMLFNYTNDHKFLIKTPELAEQINIFMEHYNLYIKSPEMSEKRKGLYNVIIYDEKSGFYIAIGRITSSMVETHIYIDVPDQVKRKCHPARLTEDGSGLSLHEFELIEDTPATCEKIGTKIYACKHCELQSSQKFPMLGHTETVDVYKSVVHDNGMIGDVRVEYCQRCKEKYYLSSPYFTADIRLWADGESYTIINYDKLNSDFYGIPESVIKDINITSVILKNLPEKWSSLRIPDGVVDLDLKKSIPQVLIIPRSVKNIVSINYPISQDLNTIYYCGTKEEWAKVKKGDFEEIWKDITVVFCPDGVSAETVKASVEDKEKG